MRIVVVAVAVAAAVHVQRAAAEPGVDVRVPPDAAPSRRVAISWHPLPAITGAGKLELDVIIVPIDHHALVLNGFYTTTATAPIVVFDDQGRGMQLPEQKFDGFGCELGYRYYTGRGGPRGLFVGPSLVFAAMHEQQGRFGDGSSTRFVDYGLAADVGYQVLVADRVALSLGAGVQGLLTSQTIPPQQLPARIYANSGVVPRIVLSIGWAL